MNIIANNVASKLFVAFVAAAMLFTLATPAKAATAEELQAQIAALMSQIASLQGGTTGGAMSAAACTFTRALTVGTSGSDVKCLQDYLTPTYFNNAGGSTGTFGPVTQAAVAAWQSANGIAPAAGYFGPVSQAKYSAMMASAPTTPTTPTTPGDDNGDDDTTSGDLSGEASIDNVEVADGDDVDDVEEGSEDVQVGEVTVEFADGDARITRLDIALDATTDGNDDVDPWDTFEEVSLWVEGDEVARVDASDEDEYLDEDDGTLRFSGLDIVAMEDEEVVIVIAVTVGGSVDGVSDGADWDIAATGLRYEDADDVTSTETTFEGLQVAASSYSTDNAEFTIEEAGEGDDLDLESSDADPESTTLALDEDDNTEAEIFAFDLSAEDSDGDIDLNEVQVEVFVSNAVDALVNDFRLEIDGQSFDAESYTGTGSSTVLTFDIDGDVTVPADEVVTASLFADFENMDSAALEGSTIHATTSAAGIDAEGVEDVTVDGTNVSGETHSLRTEGVTVELVDDTVVADENDDASTADDEAIFTLEFTVTSFGDDIYLPFGASSSTDLTSGVEFSIINTNTNAVVTTGVTIQSLDMDGDAETNSFRVSDGDEETFTLEVRYNPTVAGSYKLRLDDINFATTDAATATQTQDVSDEDIDTAQTSISA